MRTSKRVARTARRLFRACLDEGRLNDPRVRRVARHIAGSGRRQGLSILTAFGRLVRLYRDQHTAVVESAAPLNPDVRDDVRAALARRYGPGVEASFAEDAALIGGMRVRVGSDVYDDSVRARLAAIEARL